MHLLGKESACDIIAVVVAVVSFIILFCFCFYQDVFQKDLILLLLSIHHVSLL